MNVMITTCATTATWLTNMMCTMSSFCLRLEEVMGNFNNTLRLENALLFYCTSVKVGKRSSATKLTTWGTFPGAKVTRGPDWQWRDQDGNYRLLDVDDSGINPSQGDKTVLVRWC
jgi:hypothetical protein